MSIKKWMTKDVIVVQPTTKIYEAAELMKEHNIHRLPVLENGCLVGLVTEGVIQEASPSKATSLSVYEMNYLLNKTKVVDVMLKEVLIIRPDDVLEEAIFIMRKNNVRVLPVVSENHLVGIVTDKDIFDAFLKISSYGEPGMRVLIKLYADRAGILAQVVDFLAEKDINITSVMLDRERNGCVILQLQLMTIDNGIVEELRATGFDVIDFMLT
jgi:acetoin utilization protein AcuB